MKKIVSFLTGAVVLQFLAFPVHASCRALPNAPTVINQPGVYCLTRNQSVNMASGAAISIEAGDVELDLAGFRITNEFSRVDTTATGIFTGSNSGITIRNGTLRGFSTGINMLEGRSNIVEKMRITGSNNTAIRVGGINALVRDNVVEAIGNQVEPGGEVDEACGIKVDLFGHARVVGNRIFTVRAQVSAAAICFTPGQGVAENNTSQEIRINVPGGVNGAGVKVRNAGFPGSVMVVGNKFAGVPSWQAGSTAIDVIATPNTATVCKDNIMSFYQTALSSCTDAGGNSLTP